MDRKPRKPMKYEAEYVQPLINHHPEPTTEEIAKSIMKKLETFETEICSRLDEMQMKMDMNNQQMERVLATSCSDGLNSLKSTRSSGHSSMHQYFFRIDRSFTFPIRAKHLLESLNRTLAEKQRAEEFIKNLHFACGNGCDISQIAGRILDVVIHESLQPFVTLRDNEGRRIALFELPNLVDCCVQTGIRFCPSYNLGVFINGAQSWIRQAKLPI